MAWTAVWRALLAVRQPTAPQSVHERDPLRIGLGVLPGRQLGVVRVGGTTCSVDGPGSGDSSPEKRDHTSHAATPAWSGRTLAPLLAPAVTALPPIGDQWPEDTGVDRRSPPHQGLVVSHSRDPRHPEHTGRSKQNGRQIRDPGASRAGHRHRACRAMGCRVAPPRSTHDPPGTPSTRSREMPNRWLRGRPVRFATSSVHPADHRREQRAIAPPGRRRTGGQEAVLTRDDCRSAGARGWQHR